MSHGISALCVNDSFLLAGGEYRPNRKEAHWLGLRVAEVDDLDNISNISRYHVLKGDPRSHGCIDHWQLRGFCEFDNKPGIYRNKTGTTFLFTRANMGPLDRWVQMTSSDDLKHW